MSLRNSLNAIGLGWIVANLIVMSIAFGVLTSSIVSTIVGSIVCLVAMLALGVLYSSKGERWLLNAIVFGLVVAVGTIAVHGWDGLLRSTSWSIALVGLGVTSFFDLSRLVALFASAKATERWLRDTVRRVKATSEPAQPDRSTTVVNDRMNGWLTADPDRCLVFRRESHMDCDTEEYRVAVLYLATDGSQTWFPYLGWTLIKDDVREAEQELRDLDIPDVTECPTS